MASSLEVNKILAAILTAGIIASGSGVISRIVYHPHVPEEPAYPIAVAATEDGAEAAGGEGPAVSLAALLPEASVEEGQAVAKKCAACHTFEEGGAAKIGPPLWGVVGRDIASAEGFAYSDALTGLEGAWDYDRLGHFLADPKGFAAGTKMAFAGLKKDRGSRRRDRLSAVDLARRRRRCRSRRPDRPPPRQRPERRRPSKRAAQAPSGAQPAASAEPAEGGEQPAEQVAAVQPAEQAGGQPAAAAQGEGSLAALLAAADPAAGEKSAKKCGVCHSFEQGGAAKLGPPLWGVLGRDIASAPDFRYSEALTEKDGSWDYDKLHAYLTNPKQWAPGNKMAFAGVKKPEELANIIVYLRSLADNPQPLPAGG